jgi:carbamoyltransferase
VIICGLKLTHDGAIAVIDGNHLAFSVEMEKLGNNRRYSQIDNFTTVVSVLGDFGYKPGDIDEWAVDGWDGADCGTASLLDGDAPVELTVASYRESDRVPDLMRPGYCGTLPIGGRDYPYASYAHVAGHLASAYATSPFAGEPSFVLIWDGGLFPRLYFVDSEGRVENGAELFPLIGHAYATAAHHFGPFRRDDEATAVDDLSVAGKLMAYIALGEAREDACAILRELFHDHFEAATEQVAEYRRRIHGTGSHSEPSLTYVHAFYRDVRAAFEARGISEEDALTSVHQMLEDLLIERIVARVRSWKGDGPFNLCFTGGCALNIKWNSALRRQSLFRAVWVPPFPNDSGSAVGTAAAHYAALTGRLPALQWHPRSGPALRPMGRIPAGWDARPCSAAGLAAMLHESGRPVVVLNGRAEVGPRALGGRSIIAPAHDPGMKRLLNEIKHREDYRPVAPICPVEFAPQVFDPGVPDPHMLFDHKIRADWVDRIPAVMHLDGTARLQTVSESDDAFVATLLREYGQLSGVPVLCNTSANLHGSGFFPDVRSAMEWGRIDLIYSDGTLYSREASR